MITVECSVNAPINLVWEAWNQPEHITNWYFASADWHAPSAENDLRVGGKFKTRMEARDGTMGFDFEGVYTNVVANECIEYKLADDRKVKIVFTQTKDGVKVAESFDTEKENTEVLQRNGWHAILNNFKKYVESL